MPNTLEQLNGFSNQSVLYQDQRAYSIAFSPATAVNQSISIVEDAPFTSTAGIDITSMVSTPRNLRYRIDLSSLTFTAYIDWGTLPAGIITEIPGTNIFDLVGPFDNVVWNLINEPTITVPDQSSNFSYTSTLTYPDPANTANDLTKSWTTSVTVTATPDLSTPVDWSYVKNSPGTVDGTPQIIQVGAGTFTMTVTPSVTAAVSSLSSTGSGGTSSFNAITKVLTITGTYTQVNDHLNNIVLTTPLNYQNTFTFTYLLTRPSGASASEVQTINPSEPFTVGTATYLEDIPFALQYTILDQSPTAGNFTVSVDQNTPSSDAGGYFTVNSSNVGASWNITDTKANINAANVWYFPPADWSNDITFTVNQSKVDSGNTFVQASNSPVTIVNAGSNPEISNMINRSYTSNTVNNIFSTQTPYLNDGVDTGQIYTITLESTLGKFGNSAANAVAANSYSFTGNTTSCNSEFSNMVFVPNYNTSSSGTFTYTQTRGSTLQVNVSKTLTGTAGANITPQVYVYTGPGTFTPTFEQTQFGNTTIYVVGAGGAGGYWTTGKGPGGGGGGGQVLQFSRNAASDPLVGNITVTPGIAGNVVVNGNGNPGNSSVASDSAHTYTALGGQGGKISANTLGGTGGNSGSNYLGWTSTTTTGGGGGGAGGAAPGTFSGAFPGAGVKLVWQLENPGGTNFGVGGIGGKGPTSLGGLSTAGGGGYGHPGASTPYEITTAQPGQNGTVIIKII